MLIDCIVCEELEISCEYGEGYFQLECIRVHGVQHSVISQLNAGHHTAILGILFSPYTCTLFKLHVLLFYKTYCVLHTRYYSFKQILGRVSFISQLSNTYKPNYKELEIKLLGTFILSIMDHIP